MQAVKKEEHHSVIRVYEFPSLDEELEWISEDIKCRPTSEWGKCTILARARKTLEATVPILQGVGLEAYLVARKNGFESTPLQWLHAILRLANARTDREQTRRVCQAFFDLEGIEIQVHDVVANSALREGDLLRSWLEIVLARQELEDYTQPFLLKAYRQLGEQNHFLDFIQLAFSWFDKVKEHLMRLGDDRGLEEFEAEKGTWADIHEGIRAKFPTNELTLSMFLQEFDLAPKAPPIRDDAVRCFTIHRAKGMEFAHVYLIGLVEEELPTWQSVRKGNNSVEMQEERRNCFVAITRTQSSLTLTHARAYSGRAKKPSRFLYEMGLRQ